MVHIQMTYISPVSSHIWDKLWVLHWLLNLSEKASIGKAPQRPNTGETGRCRLLNPPLCSVWSEFVGRYRIWQWSNTEHQQAGYQIWELPKLHYKFVLFMTKMAFHNNKNLKYNEPFVWEREHTQANPVYLLHTIRHLSIRGDINTGTNAYWK